LADWRSALKCPADRTAHTDRKKERERDRLSWYRCLPACLSARQPRRQTKDREERVFGLATHAHGLPHTLLIALTASWFKRALPSLSLSLPPSLPVCLPACLAASPSGRGVLCGFCHVHRLLLSVLAVRCRLYISSPLSLPPSLSLFLSQPDVS